MSASRCVLGMAILGLSVTGCAALGAGKNAPDEFSIVTKAPLTLPPDFNLRPPRPGETRPERLSTADRTRQLLVGTTSEAPPSNGELALLQAVGALEVDSNIRAILAAENGGRAQKKESFANQLVFWQVDGDGNIDDSQAPLVADDPEAWKAQRQQAIEAVTGGGEVEIDGQRTRTLRLPGVY